MRSTNLPLVPYAARAGQGCWDFVSLCNIVTHLSHPSRDPRRPVQAIYDPVALAIRLNFGT